ncbi:MAG: hypothetical protein ABEJ26_11690 [Halosimplex sp.]
MTDVDRSTDAEALGERVAELADARPAERERMLADGATTGGAERVLSRLFSPVEGGPRVADVLHALRAHGYSREEAIDLLTTALGAEDLQSRWARSGDVERRDELLLRLQVLSRTPTLAADLVPFLALHLRSPDPAVYQAAAVAVGRHLGERPDLLAAVREYAAARSLELGEPTALGRNRTRRRILLVQAAARATDRADGSSLPELLTSGNPLDTESVEAAHPSLDPEDATVRLLAVRLLLSAPDLAETVGPAAVDLVVDTGGDDLGGTPPIYLQRWGELLDALLARDFLGETEAADAWRSLFDRIDDALRPADEPREVAALVGPLSLLDEHARTLATLPDPVARAAVPPDESLSETHRVLLRARAGFWRRRVREGAPSDGWPADVVVPENASPALRELARVRPDSADRGVGAVGPREFDLDRIDALLAPLGDRSRWDALAPGERALRVVFLLSTVQHLDGGYERARSTVAANGVPVPPGDDTRSQTLAAVVLRLIQFEGPECARALDSRVLESISDLGVLLTLLPTDGADSFAAELADNFEHQLRWNLQRDPDFRPIQVLARTTVRDPHPAFYRALGEVVARRTYADATGRPIPVGAAVDAIREDGPDAPADPWRRDALADADPLVRARSGARDRLASATDAGTSLWDALDAFADALGVPEGPRDRPTDDTLLGLVALVHPPEDRILAGGSSPWLDETPDAFVARHAETVSALRSALGALYPDSLDDAADAADALRALGEDLSAVVEALAPVLPTAEAERLREAARALDDRVDAYAQALDAVAAAWHPLDPPRSPDDWDALLETVSARWTPPDRLPLLRAAFASLDAASASTESADDWAARRSFLEWAVRAPEGRDWTAAETDAWETASAEVWCELVEGAMDVGQESRVRDLLEAPAFGTVRDRPSAVETLDDAREWALDRYLLGLATHVRALLPSSEGASPWRVRLREAGAFLVHHSSVWTALIVGAVLMQDFGTAWQAMAEQGDVNGIALTFVLAVAGAFGYVLLSLRRTTTRAPGESRWAGLRSRLARASLFVAVCLAFTLLVTGFLWWLLSGTDQVVHGPGAALLVVVWLSFALLAGIFFGLVAKAA